MTKTSSKSSQDESTYISLDDRDNYFYTYDLGLAAALTTAGFPLALLDRTLPKVQFIFHRGRGIDQAVEKYWSGKLQLDARGLFDTLKMLKNRLYSK